MLAIDPGGGVRRERQGWALFESGWLLQCGNGIPSVPSVNYLVVEKPQVYRQAKQKGDPNDLIDLAVLVGQAIERYTCSDPARHRVYLPAQWKGQVPKDIHHRRIMGTIDVQRDQIRWLYQVPESYRHNVLDAVGLGLFLLHQERIR
jgi:hypothetical protein